MTWAIGAAAGKHGRLRRGGHGGAGCEGLGPASPLPSSPMLGGLVNSRSPLRPPFPGKTLRAG
jgi:hypothetical protein